MKIQDKDIYHGPALMQIVEHGSFKALNKADAKYGHYLVNTNTRLWAKYSAAERGPWSFTFQPTDVKAIVSDKNSSNEVFVVLTCGHDTICCLGFATFNSLVDVTSSGQQWIKVDAPKGKQMRVTGSNQPKDPILVAHNEFPDCIFSS